MARVLINKNRCKGCYLCIAVCPEKILLPSQELNERGIHPCDTSDAEACIGCLNCTRMCPDAALIIIDPPRAKADAKEPAANHDNPQPPADNG